LVLHWSAWQLLYLGESVGNRLCLVFLLTGATWSKFCAQFSDERDVIFVCMQIALLNLFTISAMWVCITDVMSSEVCDKPET
jgi:hypothetical protein